jgi:hypothetical protein
MPLSCTTRVPREGSDVNIHFSYVRLNNNLLRDTNGIDTFNKLHHAPRVHPQLRACLRFPT